MLRIIKFLFTGFWEPSCTHNWEEIDKYEARYFLDKSEDALPHSRKYILVQKCTNCQKLRKQEISW